jgi:hypothetical protein
VESFNSLWQHVSNPFVRIAEVFGGKFFSQRRYLHFLVSGVAIFFIFFFGNDVKDLQLENNIDLDMGSYGGIVGTAIFLATIAQLIY